MPVNRLNPNSAILSDRPPSSLLLLSSLDLGDTKAYEPLIRALLGTASHKQMTVSQLFQTDSLTR